MAINDVRLFGQVSKAPDYFFRRNEETPNRVQMSIKTISRYYNSQERDRIVFDEVLIMTQSPEMIQKIRTDLHEGDIVYIKGMICTADITRKIICGECEEQFRESGITSYVHPINIYVVKNNLTEKEGNILIQRNAEISNEVIVDGVICTDVHYMEAKHYAYYKLAVKRAYHILEDDPDKRLDYPAVNTYFEQAESDSKYVHKGTRMNARGSIRVRSIARHVLCPHCGNTEDIRYKVLEIVASNISYTANWDAYEETKEPEVIEENSFDDVEDILVDLAGKGSE